MIHRSPTIDACANSTVDSERAHGQRASQSERFDPSIEPGANGSGDGEPIDRTTLDVWQLEDAPFDLDVGISVRRISTHPNKRVFRFDPDERWPVAADLDDGRGGVGVTIPGREECSNVVAADSLLEPLEHSTVALREIAPVLTATATSVANSTDRGHLTPRIPKPRKPS